MATPKQALVNDFSDRSFRNVADRDYLAARILYRYGLGPQFLWSAFQALEKYFKAILLYNGRSTKNLSHDIVAAFDRVRTIDDIPFDFPQDVETFVRYLNEEGGNRYFEYPSYTLGEELLSLDRTVWHVRRYCYYMRGQIKTHTGQVIDCLPLEIKRVQSQTPHQAHKVRLWGGYLEKVLDQQRSKLREHLVWKNFFYYGTYRKKLIKNYQLHSWSANPTHYLHPEVFDHLDALVQFSPGVRQHFASRKKP